MTGSRKALILLGVLAVVVVVYFVMFQSAAASTVTTGTGTATNPIEAARIAAGEPVTQIGLPVLRAANDPATTPVAVRSMTGRPVIS